MIQLLERRRDELDTLCREYGVRTLEVFGSAATDEAYDPGTSDLDFLVDFVADKTANAADRYFGLRAALEALFERPVDLVMTNALRNRFFIQSVNETRRVLYAA